MSELSELDDIADQLAALPNDGQRHPAQCRWSRQVTVSPGLFRAKPARLRKPPAATPGPAKSIPAPARPVPTRKSSDIAIRSVPDITVALRLAQVERELSHSLIDNLSGLPDGYTSKLLGPRKIRTLGLVSLAALLGALGKKLVLVDDPEQMRRVEHRWKKRHLQGGATTQLRRLATAAEDADVAHHQATPQV